MEFVYWRKRKNNNQGKGYPSLANLVRGTDNRNKAKWRKKRSETWKIIPTVTRWEIRTTIYRRMRNRPIAEHSRAEIFFICVYPDEVFPDRSSKWDAWQYSAQIRSTSSTPPERNRPNCNSRLLSAPMKLDRRLLLSPPSNSEVFCWSRQRASYSYRLCWKLPWLENERHWMSRQKPRDWNHHFFTCVQYPFRGPGPLKK